MRLLFFILFFPLVLMGQAPAGDGSYNWRRAVVGGGLAFISGASWGVHETVVHHPGRIPRKWNRYYWDNSVSWQNKYYQRDPENGPAYLGSTTFLAWTTDAKHLFGTVHRVSLFAAGVSITIGEKRPAWHYLVDAGLSFCAFSAGFHSTYTILFHK